MKYRTAPGVILTEVCDRYFLVTPKESIEVNETAAFYLKILNAGVSFDELLNLAREEYEIEDAKILRHDIQDLISTMMKKQLLVRCGS